MKYTGVEQKPESTKKSRKMQKQPSRKVTSKPKKTTRANDEPDVEIEDSDDDEKRVFDQNISVYPQSGSESRESDSMKSNNKKSQKKSTKTSNKKSPPKPNKKSSKKTPEVYKPTSTKPASPKRKEEKKTHVAARPETGSTRKIHKENRKAKKYGDDEQKSKSSELSELSKSVESTESIESEEEDVPKTTQLKRPRYQHSRPRFNHASMRPAYPPWLRSTLWSRRPPSAWNPGTLYPSLYSPKPNSGSYSKYQPKRDQQ